MMYNLVFNGVPTDKLRAFDDAPPDVLHKGMVWLRWVDNRLPGFDADTHKLGPVEKAVVGSESIWSRPVVALTPQELTELKNRKIADTDHKLVRIIEEIMVLFAQGKQPVRADFPQAVWDKINERRALRGQDPV